MRRTGATNAATSFAYDNDGDLRHHNGQRCYGDAIEALDVPESDAVQLLMDTWPDQECIFRPSENS